MDRFIDSKFSKKERKQTSLKSNMDRFIGYTTVPYWQGSGTFKIQYG